MRVRCIAERLTHEQAVAHYYPHPPDMRISFAASLGVEYEVYSINCTYPFAMVGISDGTSNTAFVSELILSPDTNGHDIRGRSEIVFSLVP